MDGLGDDDVVLTEKHDANLRPWQSHYLTNKSNKKWQVFFTNFLLNAYDALKPKKNLFLASMDSQFHDYNTSRGIENSSIVGSWGFKRLQKFGRVVYLNME